MKTITNDMRKTSEEIIYADFPSDKPIYIKGVYPNQWHQCDCGGKLEYKTIKCSDSDYHECNKCKTQYIFQ